MEVLQAQHVQCYHCGTICDQSALEFEEHQFCCSGCLSVYQLLHDHQLQDYYQLNRHPGATNALQTDQFYFLDDPEIQQRLLQFNSKDHQIITLKLPQIHCSSCIWLLEHLGRLHPGVLSSRVNFTTKQATIRFDPQQISLHSLVELLTAIGYEPSLRLDASQTTKGNTQQQNLLIKIGVAGFCFGNIMLLSFPEYLGLTWDAQGNLDQWFSTFMLILSLPVVFYCAIDYFKGAFHGLVQRYLNIEIPIAIGILALFIQSCWEIFSGAGPGYLDSLAGLLFLLLLGRWFQERTYQGLSFDRDYTAYFPMAVSKREGEEEQTALVTTLKPGDHIVLRNQQLIPVDAVNLDRATEIDYSFVTGESDPVLVEQGSYVYAGGRHLGPKSGYQVLKPVDQSYLTQLWNQGSTQVNSGKHRLINLISRYFTPTILAIALVAAGYWWWYQPQKALFVFTAVLIVACPCALSMTTPFTLGSAMRLMGLNGFYLKNATIIENLATIDQVVFDKTGTLTTANHNVEYQGNNIDTELAAAIMGLVAQSSHPRSIELAAWVKKNYPVLSKPDVYDFKEIVGQGLEGQVGSRLLKVGRFQPRATQLQQSELWVGQTLWGVFQFDDRVRSQTGRLMQDLRQLGFSLDLMSGDHEGKEHKIKSLFLAPEKVEFDCSPHEKLNAVKARQHSGHEVLMIGDGLNDAGALAQSDVGVAISNDAHHFTPASDAILTGKDLYKLPKFLRLARSCRSIIIGGFVLSFLYNVVGLSLAVQGLLTPLLAAVLMPLSSISVVIFSTLCVTIRAKTIKLK